MRPRWLLALSPLLLAATPAPNDGFVLNCYLEQSGQLGRGPFVRHLQIYPGQGIVSIADGFRGGTPRFVGNGALVSLDAARLVFDFESPSSSGRTEIDRRSGTFVYRDGRVVLSGSCQTSTLLP